MLYEEEALSHVEKEKIIYDAVFSKIIRIFVAKTACNKRTAFYAEFQTLIDI